ncbi:MAG: (d)CMP kinase [Ignavibacteriales bacterium]|nr:(d)CMP kinase [Ignavibacteriales bacterium]
MLKKIIIAIDGPAGSGKSTAAKNIAEKLGFTYLDTGAMYRAITFLALQKGIADDVNSVIELARKISLKLKFENGITRVFVDGIEVTEEIRKPEINSKVSDISKIPEVRAEMVKIQKRMGSEGNIIAEGRDVTTVVFPDADFKIFMTATLEERVRRRFKEFQEKNVQISFDEVKANLQMRDEIDSNRTVSPLKKADDALEFDNSKIGIEEELNILLDKIEEIRKKV